MNTEPTSDPGTAVLALLAYQNLCAGESLFHRTGSEPELVERVPAGRLGAEVLTRYTRMCDAIPGGQNGATAAMQTIASPVDEFIAMTRPRLKVEHSVRLLFIASLQYELVQRVASGLPDVVVDAIGDEAASWRMIDATSAKLQETLAADARAVDTASNYARRVIGEAAVMGQRLVIREEGLRRALTGGPDEDLSGSTPVLDELLAAASARLARLGLSV